MAKNNPNWFCQKLTVDNVLHTDGSRVITEEDLAKEREEGMKKDIRACRQLSQITEAAK